MTNELWQKIKETLEGRLDHTVYTTYFKDMTFAAKNNHHYYLAVNDEFTSKIIPSIHNQTVADIISDVTGEPAEVIFIAYEKDVASMNLSAESMVAEEPASLGNMNLLGQTKINPDNNFENFVVGKSNQYAHAVCLGTAESMAHDLGCHKNYNPIFIYGGSGLGKTHLMHAVAQHVLVSQPKAKIVYVPCETFMNEMIEAIGSNRTAAFRNKYRQVDLLLIDDIQFLSERKGTQEEFFHTFAGLYEANRQIIICSDRPPNEIETLQDRLRTRFQGGIIADIQMPDLETRIAILRKRAQITNAVIDDDVMEYIAEHLETSIRELEGAWLSVTTYASFNNLPLTVELAQDCLSKQYHIEEPKIIDAAMITQKVCELYGLNQNEIIGKSRKKNIVIPRQMAMYLCRHLTDMSLPKIGEYFGGRDHTTVIHAVEKMEKDMQKDQLIKTTLQNLSKELKGE